MVCPGYDSGLNRAKGGCGMERPLWYGSWEYSRATSSDAWFSLLCCISLLSKELLMRLLSRLHGGCALLVIWRLCYSSVDTFSLEVLQHLSSWFSEKPGIRDVTATQDGCNWEKLIQCLCYISQQTSSSASNVFVSSKCWACALVPVHGPAGGFCSSWIRVSVNCGYILSQSAVTRSYYCLKWSVIVFVYIC